MRICQVAPYDLSRHGGVTKHVLCLASALRTLGDEVEVIGPASEAPLDEHVTGFSGVVSIEGNGSENRLGLLTSPVKVWAYLRDRPFDVIHVHEPLNPMLPYYALWSADARGKVATFHCYAERETRRSRWARQLLAPHLRSFDRGIAVSEPAARYARVAWPRPLAVIPNGVDADFFSPETRDARHAGATRLLFVGQWRDARKGLSGLLAAHRLLRAGGNDVFLDVVGEGDAKAAAPVGPEEGVQFHGRVPETVLRALLHQCDIFVAPSLGGESFGMVLLEAMAAGRQIVCTDIEGYRRVASAPGARFVPPGDVPALAEALAALCADPVQRRRMGQHNLTAARRYDWANIAREVRREYEGAVGLGPTADHPGESARRRAAYAESAASDPPPERSAAR